METTLREIKAANRAAGHFWFEPETVRFFGSRIHSEVHEGPGGIYFVSSEQPPHGPRGYAVRQFNPENSHIETVGEVCQYPTGAAAHRAARTLAAGVAA